MYGNERGGQRGPRGFGGNTAPVKVGDELEVTIEAVGEKGDGLAKKDGFVIFVPNVKAGDKVRIRITKVLRKVGFAEVISKEGVEAPAEAPEEAGEEAPKEEVAGAPEETPAEDTEDFGEEEKPSPEES